MKKFWLIFFLLCAISPWAKEVAGKVVDVEGQAKAKIKGRKDRKLGRGSVIFTDEVIQVEGSSKLQIRFTDGGLLNLIPNSKYQIQAYNYSTNKTSNQYIGQIFAGGFRQVSGQIAKNNPDRALVKTPTSTIGMRGTSFEVLVLSNNSVTVGCELGQISVTNAAGQITLGPSSPYQYSTISSTNTKPLGLKDRPANFNAQLFDSPARGIQTTSKGTDKLTPPVRIKGGC
jgi:hypothetical protein